MIRPGSQCAPWIAQGTTCSSRQKAALRSPSGSAARKPASRLTSTPHQLQTVLIGGGKPSHAGGGFRARRLSWRPMADRLRIAVLEGDETGQELLEQACRVLDPEVAGMELELDRYDLSLENRRATANEVVSEAAAAMNQAGFGVKAATVTPEGKDD